MKGLWQRMSLSQKFLLIIVVMSIAATVSIAPAMFFATRRAMYDLQRGHLTGIKNLVERLIDENRMAIRNYAILFSNNRLIKDNLFYHSVLQGERVHPLRAARHLVESFDVEYIELTDRNGWLVANTKEPHLYYVNRAYDPLIASALKGKVDVGIEEQDEGFILKAVSPIYYDQGQLIGTLTTGVVMDRDFLVRMKQLSGVNLAIVRNTGKVVSSTLEDFKGRLNPETTEVFYKGRRFLLMSLPLKDTNKGSIIILTEDRLPFLLKRLHLATSAVLVIVAVLFSGGAFFVLQRLFGPLKMLMKGAEEVGKGNFQHRIEVTSRDEIGQLATVFNQMAENLQRMKEIEAKLQHSERLASIGQFTSGIAHELNNPIANVIGLLKLVRNDLREDSPVREDIEIAIKEAQRCGRIVRDLLLYSRQSPPQKEPVDLNSLIREVVEGIKLQMDGKDVTVVQKLKPEIPLISVDPVQIEQVIRNIVTNAFQAIEKTGTIEITTYQKDSSVEIKISDTGCGIKKDHLDKIFYPFFTTKRTGEGTGLGLTVSYGIVTAHGGDIRVSSEEGKGTTFYITLPLDF